MSGGEYRGLRPVAAFRRRGVCRTSGRIGRKNAEDACRQHTRPRQCTQASSSPGGQHNIGLVRSASRQGFPRHL